MDPTMIEPYLTASICSIELSTYLGFFTTTNIFIYAKYVPNNKTITREKFKLSNRHDVKLDRVAEKIGGKYLRQAVPL